MTGLFSACDQIEHYSQDEVLALTTALARACDCRCTCHYCPCSDPKVCATCAHCFCRKLRGCLCGTLHLVDDQRFLAYALGWRRCREWHAGDDEASAIPMKEALS